jgi:hypothetical protein
MTSHRWLIALAIAGCGGQTKPNPGTNPDGGHDSMGHPNPDGALPDAAPDRIDIAVLPDYLNDPVANLPVLFSAADGSVLGVEMTDATGHTSHMVTTAASVTLIKPSGNQGTVTIMAVQPGTTLRFGALWKPRATVATMHVTWPAETAGAFYDVETPCGGFGTYYQESSGQVALDARCTGPFGAVIASYLDGEVREYMTLSNQTVSDGGTIAFTGSWTPVQSFLASYTGLPNNTTLIGTLAETYGQERYFDSSASMSSFSTNGSGALAFALPPAVGSELHEQVDAYMNAGNQSVGRRLAYTDPTGFDLGAALAPNITTASFNATASTLSWTTEAGAAPQVVRADLHYPGTTNSYPTWVVVAPGSVTSVTIPQLPSSLAQYAITGQVQGGLQLFHLAKSYADVVGDVDLWIGRSNINRGSIDWQGAPADLTGYTAPTATF